MNTQYSLAVVALLCLGSAGCHVEISSSSGSQNWKVETESVHNGSIPADTKILEVENRYGALRIVGSESGKSAWSQKLKVRATDDLEAKRIEEGATCVADGAGHLKLMVPDPRSYQRGSFSSDLLIAVPKNVVIRARNPYGRISISGFDDEVEAFGQSGSIDIRDVKGNVRAETSYSGLKVENVGPARLKNLSGSIEAIGVQGNLTAETSYAALTVRDIHGPVKLRNRSGRIEAESVGEAGLETSYAAIRLRKVSGDVKLVNVSGRVEVEDVSGKVNARTSYAPMDVQGAGRSFVCENQSGSIRVRASSEALAELDAKTSYARLNVQLPAKLKPAIQARTSYAEVESDFPVIMSKDADPFQGLPPETPRVRLRNESGKIQITAN